jgi:hypothetical protein
MLATVRFHVLHRAVLDHGFFFHEVHPAFGTFARLVADDFGVHFTGVDNSCIRFTGCVIGTGIKKKGENCQAGEKKYILFHLVVFLDDWLIRIVRKDIIASINYFERRWG